MLPSTKFDAANPTATVFQHQTVWKLILILDNEKVNFVKKAEQCFLQRYEIKMQPICLIWYDFVLQNNCIRIKLKECLNSTRVLAFKLKFRICFLASFVWWCLFNPKYQLESMLWTLEFLTLHAFSFSTSETKESENFKLKCFPNEFL